MHQYSDEKLVNIFKSDNSSRKKKAFDCLYLRYKAPLTQYFFFALHNDYEKARDFFHDLFLKLLESPEKFDSGKPFKPWIFRVASNMCKNYYRNIDVVGKFKDYVLHNAENQLEIVPNEKLLRESIRQLTQDHRSFIVLRFKINLSIKEIADIFECPEGTVKSRLFYATKELAKFYKESNHGTSTNH